ncbi:MAG: TonB-dependent receptor [Bacteroidales bacterium]|nr:TonB-dependent receptor [Bacteroidales bacterium]
MNIRAFCLAVAFLLSFAYIGAQVTTSGITGKITLSGEPATGVTIKAVHEPSNTIYGTVTNGEGLFSLSGMRTGGPYRVTVSYIGYDTAGLDDIFLQLGVTKEMDVDLKESATALGEVSVTASKSKFSSGRSGVSTNIGNDQLTSLPTINRSVADFARLSPYANDGFSFAGADGRMSGFTIDGANLNNNMGLTSDLPGGGNPISLDAIEEMQVVIAPYDVRQSNFAGGAVNAITKSGTNQFRGAAYTYFRNEKMRGNKIDGESLGAREKESTAVYGFTLGGPIVKNKLFFFVNGEYQNSPYQITKFRPRGVADEQQNSSRVTEGDMDEFASILRDRYGYDAGSYNDFDGGNTNYKALVRIDWNIGDAHKLSVRYNFTTNREDLPTFGNSGVGTRATSYRISKNAMAFDKTCYAQKNDVSSLAAELNSRFSSIVSNRLIFTYSDMGSTNTSKSDPFPFIDIWDGNGDSYMSAGYDLFSWNNKPRNTIYNVQDNVVVYLNRHTLTAGLSFEYQRAYNMYMKFGTGYYKYASFDDFKNGAAPLAFGLTYGYNGETEPRAEVLQAQTALYVQDEWNVTDRFRLSLGLRADMLNFLNDLETNRGYYDIDFNGRRIDTGFWPKTNLLFSPRLGFSWDVTEDKSVRLRGGSGIFTGRIPLVFFTNMPTNSGMLQNTVQLTDAASLDKLKGGLVTGVNRMVEVLGLPTSPAFNSASDIVGASIVGIDRSFKLPQLWKSSIAVDYKPSFPFPLTFSAEFMYSKNINAVYQENLNVVDPSQLTRFNGPDDRLFYKSAKNTAIASNVSGGAMLLKNTNRGHSSAVTVMVSGEPVRDLNFMVAYTHTESRETSGNPGTQSYSAWQNIPSVDSPNLADLHASQYLTPNKVILSLSYKIEYAKHFATHVGVFYSGYNPGNYSYMYVTDMNQDGQKNDLIYIPKTRDELMFVDKNGFTAAEQAAAFWDFVNQDPYLKKHKGEYAEAYGAYLPWLNRVDVRVAQDFKVKAGKSWNTLQVSVDILNFANLLNSSWGVIQSNSACNGGRLLQYEGVTENNVPRYSMYYDAATKSLPSKTFESTRSTANCWQLQIGVRYCFN